MAQLDLNVTAGEHEAQVKEQTVRDVKITFFMIVTDRDIVIADYAVRSYAKIKGIHFKLIVYSNWVTSRFKERYFPVWRQFNFVEIVENNWQTDDNKPTDPHLWGPFELGATIWDRELKRIQTPYVTTVDADFEILDAQFIPHMLARLEADPKLALYRQTTVLKSQPFSTPIQVK